MCAQPMVQEALKLSDTNALSVEPFRLTLAKHGLELTRGQTNTLQVNTGLLCNQACRHCHLEAAPNRTELMDAETVDEVVAFVPEEL